MAKTPDTPPAGGEKDKDEKISRRNALKRMLGYGGLAYAGKSVAEMRAEADNAEFAVEEAEKLNRRPILHAIYENRALDQLCSDLRRKGVQGFIIGDGNHASIPVINGFSSIVHTPGAGIKDWFIESAVPGHEDLESINNADEARASLNIKAANEARAAAYDAGSAAGINVRPTDTHLVPKIDKVRASLRNSWRARWDQRSHETAFNEAVIFRNYFMADRLSEFCESQKKTPNPSPFAFTVGASHSDVLEPESVPALLDKAGIKTAKISVFPYKGTEELNGRVYALKGYENSYVMLVHDPVMGKEISVKDAKRAMVNFDSGLASMILQGGPPLKQVERDGIA